MKRAGVRLGVTLPQFTADPQVFRDGVRRAEALGLDSIWVFDHMWPLSGGKERPVLECWSALAWAAGATERVGLGTLVTRSTLRNPEVLAHIAQTVATIAPGRLTVAIGSGDEDSREENLAFGLPYLEGDARVQQLQEAVQVVREKVAPVWVAGHSDEVIEVAAHSADGWNGWGGTVDGFRAGAAKLRAEAGDREMVVSWAGIGERGIDAETLAERLSGYVSAGAQEVILTFPHAGEPGAYEMLAGPVREALLYPRGV